MSDVAKGAQRVRAVEEKLHSYGYRTMIASRSGQRRGARSQSLALDGDLIAIAPEDSPWPHFIIEVGGPKKSVKASIAEMTALPLPPGFTPIVVRLVDSRCRRPGEGWRWSAASGAHDTLAELLDALRGPATAHF